MKKICIFKYHFNEISGGGVVAVKLANELLDDYDVHILSVSTKEGNIKNFMFKEGNIKNFMLDERITYSNLFNGEESKGSFFSRVKAIRDYLVSNNIDIVFSVGISGQLILMLATVGLKVKTVMCDHTSVYNDYGSKKFRITRYIGTKLSDKIVVLTNENKKGYIEKYKVLESKIQVIYNWIDELKIDKEYSIESRRILTVGRLEPVKGYDMLLQVALKVLTDNPQWKWSICGDGDATIKKQLEDFVEKNDLQGRVILHGKVSDMSSIYRDSAIYVLTSRNEGLPLVLLEAKQFGIPIVSFNCQTGPSEIIRHGINGYLVEDFNLNLMENRINELISDEEKRRQFSQNSYLDIEKFSKEEILQQWKDLIKELTN